MRSRRTPRTAAAVAATVGVGAAALAPTALAASLSAPATAAVGGRVTVHAKGLVPGRYEAFLAYTEKVTKGGQAINCIAAIGPAKTTSKSATFTGKVPSRLVCRTGAGPSLGTQAVTGGRYDIAVGSPDGSGAFNGDLSFVQRSITIT